VVLVDDDEAGRGGLRGIELLEVPAWSLATAGGALERQPMRFEVHHQIVTANRAEQLMRSMDGAAGDPTTITPPIAGLVPGNLGREMTHDVGVHQHGSNPESRRSTKQTASRRGHESGANPCRKSGNDVAHGGASSVVSAKSNGCWRARCLRTLAHNSSSLCFLAMREGPS
jgi:hypothetical protein